MLKNRAEGLSRFCVPDAGGIIGGTGQDAVAIGAENRRHDIVLMQHGANQKFFP